MAFSQEEASWAIQVIKCTQRNLTEHSAHIIISNVPDLELLPQGLNF